MRTLRRWWARLRDEGIEGVFRKPRNDRGQARLDREHLLRRAVELKLEQPRRSVLVINQILREEFGVAAPRSTLYRHLRLAGATRVKLGLRREKVRCRWTREQSNALWVGDFEHGPKIIHQGRIVPTHLSAWIDCHSRLIVDARYYIRENLDILMDSLLRAWSRHGASRELYVDNAKIYHSHALQLACTELNIKLLHRPPRDPAAGGLIERFFQTLQGQLEAEIQAADPLSLAEINIALQDWLEVAYHETLHREIQQTPRQRYEAGAKFHRAVDPASIAPLFYRREQRTVDRDFSDVTVQSRCFAVDPKLRGDKLEVRWDPFQQDGPSEVQLYSPDGRYLGMGRFHQREKREQPSGESPPAAPITPSYLDALRQANARRQQQREQSGLDFHSAKTRNEWSFNSFTRLIAKLLGRQLSALGPRELEMLKAFHQQHPRMHEALVRQAAADVDSPTITHVLLRIQTLLEQGAP